MESVKRAINTPGFSFIEALSPCPTQYGRRNELGDPVEMYRWLMERCLPIEDAAGLSEEELSDKIITGEFIEY